MSLSQVEIDDKSILTEWRSLYHSSIPFPLILTVTKLGKGRTILFIGIRRLKHYIFISSDMQVILLDTS